MLIGGAGEARIVDAALLLMAAQAARLVRNGAPAPALAHLGAGAALALALRSALRGGRSETRVACLTLALVCHLFERSKSAGGGRPGGS